MCLQYGPEHVRQEPMSERVRLEVLDDNLALREAMTRALSARCD